MISVEEESGGEGLLRKVGDPSQMWMMDPLLDMLRTKLPCFEALFKNFVPSGFVLMTVNGITQYIAAWLLFRNLSLYFAK
ncbi:MAG: hypothetical protein ACI3ZS_06960 [Candidatus Cryptobacteroides sp.]